jgi:hypothetical protein
VFASAFIGIPGPPGLDPAGFAATPGPPGLTNAGSADTSVTPGLANRSHAYASALEKHITAYGPTSFADLGTALKRPPGIPKLKKFVESRKEFSIDADGRVSLSHTNGRRLQSWGSFAP